jgi:cyclohexanone monooxygenase
LSAQDEQTPDLDYDALARKYEEERAKRLKAEGLGQFREMTGALASFARDPFADPQFTRDPINREADVLIVGGGFGGLLAGAHLREQGVKEIVVVDRAADFGGTWYWNRYPGVRCDVDALVYMPLLEETGHIPSDKYAKGAEIYELCRRIGEQFDLYRDAMFQTGVESMAWSPERERWIVTTDRGDSIAARFIVSATGHYSKPKLPGIPGIESFEGACFHTSRWDYAFTGGNADGDLTGLTGKKVGVIGTGSTGIQCVPPLAEWAEQLYVFQRTPCSVDVRGNRPTDVDWIKAQPPGWWQKRVENFTNWTSGIQDGEDMVSDSWTNLLGEPTAVAGGVVGEVDPQEMLRAELRKMESVRQRIASLVEDEKTAEALKPWYHYFCKRPGFSDDYLQTFNRPNVTLVDTEGQGVQRITPTGVVANGKEYALDCLVFATGFDFMTSYTREAGFSITGRDGLSLDSHWSRGARTLWGMQTRGFPNFFLMSLLQSGVSINYMHIADAQTRYIATVIAHCLKNGVATVEPSAEAENTWVERCVELSSARKAFLEACTPGYFNQEGQPRPENELNMPFGGGPHAYLDLVTAAREGGFAENLEFGQVTPTGEP